MPTFSRQSSTTSLGSFATAPYSMNGTFEPTAQWIDSWLTELPLHTILSIIDQVGPKLRRSGSPSTDNPSINILATIQSAQVRGIDPSPIKIQYFEWSPLSMGWYESLLWGFVFTSEMQVAKGTVGVWNGTAIKLFRVETVAAHGPTLSSPRGAVDAVGSNIVSRIGSINLRGTSVTTSPVGGEAPRNTDPIRRGSAPPGTGARTGNGDPPRSVVI
jgi:hypothetical protein